jgi:CRP-like cAMP-binding protein
MTSDTSTTLEPMVRKLVYRVPLDADDRAAVLALPFEVRRAERGAYLVREGDIARKCCVMLSGYSVRSKTVRSGARQILAIHMKGEMVDLQNSMLIEADHSVEMLTSGIVAEIPRDEIVRIAFERPMVARAMWLDTLVDGSIFREWITNIGRRDARTRLAHVLCEFALRLQVAGLGTPGRYEMPMTQEQLADATGLTPVHVNRTIRALEAEGLILRDNPRFICIVDWQTLADVGDFESRYLHLREGDGVVA